MPDPIKPPGFFTVFQMRKPDVSVYIDYLKLIHQYENLE
jgi:hypothetical protein